MPPIMSVALGHGLNPSAGPSEKMYLRRLIFTKVRSVYSDGSGDDFRWGVQCITHLFLEC